MDNVVFDFSWYVIVVGIGFVVLILLFTVVSRASLCEAKAGEVYNFEYLQPLNGEAKKYLQGY